MNENNFSLSDVENAFRAGFSLGSDKGDDPHPLFHKMVIRNADIAWGAYYAFMQKIARQDRANRGV